MDAIGQPTLEPPRRLERHDRRGDFTCGNDELDQWFHRYSWQNQKAHNAVTYVAQQGGRIAGYYALAAATIRRDWSPASFAAHRPQSIPCMLLARLAVDRRVQGQGVGTTLLLDALRRHSRRPTNSVSPPFSSTAKTRRHAPSTCATSMRWSLRSARCSWSSRHEQLPVPSAAPPSRSSP